MRDTVNTIIDVIYQYYGDALILMLAAFSYIYLYAHEKQWRGRILYPTALVVFCIVNPVLYYFIFSKIIYWRLFWMLPNALVIACTATKMIQNCNKRLEKGIIIALFAILIVIKGTNVYKNGGFVKAQNWQKVSNETKEVCDLILETDNHPRCVMPTSLFSEVRQYSGEIGMMYGRDVDKYLTQNTTNIVEYLYEEMEKESPNYEYVLNLAKSKGCNFIIVYDTKAIAVDLLEEYEYQKVGEINGIIVYYNSKVTSDKEDGWVVTQYGYPEMDASPLMFYTIEDEHENLIIIDGGFESDYNKVKWIISQYNNHVAAWIITNPHPEHVGAINAILEQDKDIIIDNIYTVNVNYNRYKEIAQYYDKIEIYEKFMELTKDLSNIYYVKAGDQIECLGLNISVLNAWDNYNDQLDFNVCDNGSLCFIVRGNIESMLFCSDIEGAVEQRIISQYQDELDVDYIQVARHGRWGLSTTFYQYTTPKVAFFDSGNTMIDPSQPQNDALELKEYFESNGTAVLNFNTVPNRVFLK